MSGANYNGRQPNNTAYIKNFIEGMPPPLWTIDDIVTTTTTLESIIVPVDPLKSVYIPGNLYISGQIINIPITENANENIHYTKQPITKEEANKLLTVEPIKIIDTITNEISYDINDTSSNISANNLTYLLLKKIQDLQEQVTNLEKTLNNLL